MKTYNPAPYQIDLNKLPNIVTNELPGPKSKEMHAKACETWDNATLFCDVVNPVDGKTFPGQSRPSALPLVRKTLGMWKCLG